MLLTMATWETMRENFSEEEKMQINVAICGETICPRGCILDVEKLGPELAAKIQGNRLAASKVTSIAGRR